MPHLAESKITWDIRLPPFIFFGFKKIPVQNVFVFVCGYKCLCTLLRFSDDEL